MIPHVEACTDLALGPADTSLPRDRAQGDMPRIAIATGFADSLECLGGSTVRDRIVLQNQLPDMTGEILSTGRSTCSGVDSRKAERWVYLPELPSMPIASGGTQNFQFTTPNEREAGERCGKVVFSDMHVSGISGAGDYPDSCGSNELTPQEKALAFMFFDIATCVGGVL